jgi:nucleotide-binding universal stress UspA family protein
MQRILAAVDDSPPGLAAARLAVRLAEQLGASLRFVHVVADSSVTSALQASGAPRLSERRIAASEALFRHVEGLARAVGVQAEPIRLYGEPAQLILKHAGSWHAELIVIGRGLERGVGGPYVGRETRMVLEFADQPVVVVPAEGPRWLSIR